MYLEKLQDQTTKIRELEERLRGNELEKRKEELIREHEIQKREQERGLHEERIRKEQEINNLFLRSKERSHYTGKAHEWLQKKGIEVVDQTTFFPSDEEIITHNGFKCINLYRKPYFKPLEKNQNYDVSWFMKHVEFLSTDEPDVIEIFLNTFASAVQRAEINRTWALFLYSGQGCGKGALFEVIAKLVGRSNSRFVRLNQLVSQFQAFLLKANNIFVREANSKGQDDSQVQATLKELISDDDLLDLF